jgi:MFS family permease
VKRLSTSTYGSVLQVEAFRWLWLAVLLARSGEAIAQTALPLLVYDLTNSSRLLGALFVVQFAPRVVLSPIAGLLADRLDRQRIMTCSAILRVVAVAGIPFVHEVWQIAGLAATISIGSALSAPAELSLLPLTVSAEQLVPALSLSQVTSNIMRIIGPAVGASLYGGFGAGAAFWTEAACFVAVVACLRPLRIASTIERSPRVSLLSGAGTEIAEGFRVSWQTPIVRGIIGAECLWSVVGAAITIAGLVYLKETLELGTRSGLVYGLLAASLSAGAVAGALIASRVERRIGRPFLLAFGYLGPILVLPVLIEPPVPVLLLCWFGFGAADALAVIAFQAYLAESVPERLRGRVYATWYGLATLAALVSYGGVGWITDRLDPSWTMASGALVVAIGGPLWLVVSGALASVRAPMVATAGAPAQVQ